MAKQFDWSAHRNRKRRPFLTHGEVKEFREQAEKLAKRVEAGHKSSTAWKHGPVKVYTEEEIAAFVAKGGRS